MAYLLFPYSLDYLIENQLENSKSFSANIQLKIFENTSSTKAELQTLLWALSEIDQFMHSPFHLTICTDSQGITSLQNRKNKLISSNFTKNGEEKIRNAEIYS